MKEAVLCKTKAKQTDAKQCHVGDRRYKAKNQELNGYEWVNNWM